jgi:hypothetical protein
MITASEQAHPLEHGPLLALLSELMTRERDGAALYHRYLDDAPAAMRDTLAASGAEIDHHVHLLERAIIQLGGDPSYVAPVAESGRRLTQELLALRETGPDRWIYRLEALFVFETRDQILWESLRLLSQKGLAAADAAVVRPAAVAVESPEALGAYNGSRHRERIRWARDTMRDLILEQLGLDAPHSSAWRMLARLFWGD